MLKIYFRFFAFFEVSGFIALAKQLVVLLPFAGLVVSHQQTVVVGVKV